jgi:hypothetical protein
MINKRIFFFAITGILLISTIGTIFNLNSIGLPTQQNTFEDIKFTQSVWTINGTAICVNETTQNNFQMCSDGVGGAIIVWEQDCGGTGLDIYAQRIDAEGNPLWDTDGIIVCDAIQDQFEPQLCSDEAGGAIIVWNDWAYNPHRAYAQRLDSNGNALWTHNGISVASGSTHQYAPIVCSDELGGAIIAWIETPTGNAFIKAQRLNETGGRQWSTSGTTQTWSQTVDTDYPLQICPNGWHGAIIVWVDTRTFGTTSGDIYAQQISSIGQPEVPENGTVICNATGLQKNPRLLRADNHSAIVTWIDDYAGIRGIYAQLIDAGTCSMQRWGWRCHHHMARFQRIY